MNLKVKIQNAINREILPFKKNYIPNRISWDKKNFRIESIKAVSENLIEICVLVKNIDLSKYDIKDYKIGEDEIKAKVVFKQDKIGNNDGKIEPSTIYKSKDGSFYEFARILAYNILEPVLGYIDDN